MARELHKYHKVTNVIFELDGVLLDTEPYRNSIIKFMAKKRFREVTDEDLSLIHGYSILKMMTLLIELTDMQATVEELVKEYLEMQKLEISTCKKVLGAQKLVNHLYSHNIPIALATSNMREELKQKIANHEPLFKLFNPIIYLPNDPEKIAEKPAPDIYKICAKRFSGKPDERRCLVFESSPAGVTAALAAGMNVAMIPSPNLSDLTATYCTTICLHSLDCFRPEQFQLPAYCRCINAH